MTKTKLDLLQMNGADCLFRHPLFRHSIYTSGCQMVADEMGAYWLIDDIIIHSATTQKLKNLDFITWVLKKEEGNSAVLIAEDGNKNLLWSTHIPFTDFDFDRIPDCALHKTGEKITFFYENDTLLLPEER